MRILSHARFLPLYIFLFCTSFLSYGSAHYRGATLPKVSIRASSLGAFSTKTTIDLNKKTLEQPKTLKDALNEQSSVNFSQMGGLGSPSTISVRGGNPNHTRVMVNGMRVNDPSSPDGAFNTAGVLPQSFDRVTLEKGAQTAYGTDALAGALTAELNKGEGDFHHTAQAMAGSYGAQMGSYRIKGQYNRFHANAGFAGLKTQGFVTKPPYLRQFPRDNLKDKSQTVNFNSRLDGDVGERTILTLFNRYEDASNFFGNTFETNPFWRADGKKSQHVMRLNHSHDVSVFEEKKGQMTHSLVVGHYETSSKNRNAFAPFGNGYQYDGQRTLFAYRPEGGGDAFKIKGAFEYEEDRLKAYILGITRDRISKEKSHTIGAMVAPSYRFNLPNSQAFTVSGSLRRDHHSSFKGITTYSYSGVYESPVKTEISASYATAYKAPSLVQLFPIGGASVANPLLRPERASNIQYGIAQPFLEMFRAEVVYFKSNIRQLITSESLPLTKWTYVNRSRAKMSGIESSLKWKRNGLGAFVSHTYVYTQDCSLGKSLKKRPRNVISTGISYDRDPWKAGVNWVYKGKGYDADPVASQKGDPLASQKIIRGKPAKTVDAYASYQVNKNVNALLRIENLFNYRNEDPLGYEKSGFGIYGGVKVEI